MYCATFLLIFQKQVGLALIFTPLDRALNDTSCDSVTLIFLNDIEIHNHFKTFFVVGLMSFCQGRNQSMSLHNRKQKTATYITVHLLSFTMYQIESDYFHMLKSRPSNGDLVALCKLRN